MALISSRGRPKGDIPSSSMADIAFLLLVFFLITTVFPRDRGLALVLPEGESIEVSPETVLHLLVQADGTVEVRHGDAQEGQVVTANAVRGVWAQSVARNPNVIAAVKTDQEAAYRYMVDVLDALTAAGAQRISLQGLPKN